MTRIGIALFMLAAACNGTPSERARKIPGDLVYFKDARTDPCFAYRPDGDSFQGMLTNVPCTDKVAALLVNPAEVSP